MALTLLNLGPLIQREKDCLKLISPRLLVMCCLLQDCLLGGSDQEMQSPMMIYSKIITHCQFLHLQEILSNPLILIMQSGKLICNWLRLALYFYLKLDLKEPNVK